MRETTTQCVSPEMVIPDGNVGYVNHSTRTDHDKKQPRKGLFINFILVDNYIVGDLQVSIWFFFVHPLGLNFLIGTRSFIILSTCNFLISLAVGRNISSPLSLNEKRHSL